MPFVHRDGVRIHFLDAGTGPTLMLLHAFPLSGEMFRPQIDALSARFRLLVPDFRGFGQSDVGPLEVNTMGTFAADVLAVLDAAEAKTAVVGGVSMGGYVTMALLGSAERRLKGLVLADTHARTDDEPTRTRREQTAREVLDKGLGHLAQQMTARLLSTEAPPSVVTEVQRLILENSPAGAAAAARGMAQRPDSRQALAHFPRPALVVYGQQDAITSREQHEELAALIPSSQLVAIPKAGHLANLEAPSEFNRTLEEFLGSLPP
jgi:pimeloyl-ACP methyl ester carboxylesterase